MKTYKRRLTIHIDADNAHSLRAGLTRAITYLTAKVLTGQIGDQKHSEETGTSGVHVILKTTSPEPGQGDAPTLWGS